MRRLCLLGVIASTLLVSLLGCGGGDSAFVSVTGSSRGPAVGGSGNSVIEDTVGDVGTNPAFVDIVKAKVTQIGRDQIVFFMELNAPVRPDNTTLYAWFIDKEGDNDGVLHPGDFSVNLVFEGGQFRATLTKAATGGNPVEGATVLLENLPFEVNGNTVRVIVGHDQLKGLSAEGLECLPFCLVGSDALWAGHTTQH
jgi:hypothetical protein